MIVKKHNGLTVDVELEKSEFDYLDSFSTSIKPDGFGVPFIEEFEYASNERLNELRGVLEMRQEEIDSLKEDVNDLIDMKKDLEDQLFKADGDFVELEHTVEVRDKAIVTRDMRIDELEFELERTREELEAYKAWESLL